MERLVAPSPVTFVSVGPAAGQQPAAGQLRRAVKPQKTIRIRQEYDLFRRSHKPRSQGSTGGPETWEEKYPQTDFAKERLQYFVVTLSRLAPTRALAASAAFGKMQGTAESGSKKFPRDYHLISFWGPAVGGASPAPEL